MGGKACLEDLVLSPKCGELEVYPRTDYRTITGVEAKVDIFACPFHAGTARDHGEREVPHIWLLPEQTSRHQGSSKCSAALRGEIVNVNLSARVQTCCERVS